MVTQASAFETVYFVLIFPKKEQPNLTPEQEKSCRLLARQIEASLQQNNLRMPRRK